jgi:hypothetical protein
MVTGLSCPAAASTSALSWRRTPIAASYSPDGGALGRGEPRFGVPPVGLVLEQREIVGLVLVHRGDPGHSGVIEPARYFRAGSAENAAVIERVFGD